MKKTIKHRTALMAAGCLFVPSTESMKIRNLEPSYAYSVWSSPVGALPTGVHIRTVAASATSAGKGWAGRSAARIASPAELASHGAYVTTPVAETATVRSGAQAGVEDTI